MIQQIKNSASILLISHVNPDGDTLGSMCAMYGVLKEMGKNPDMLIQGTLPQMYNFLPFVNEAKSYEKGNFKASNYDLVMAFDIASIDRIVEEGKRAYDMAKVTMNFDHHKTNKGYAAYNLIKSDASSCGEVLFDFFELNNIPLSKDVAKCIYTAILTDTGGFKYDNTSGECLKKAGILASLGADPHLIYSLCYGSKPKAMTLLQAHCVSNANFYKEDKVAISTISLALLDKFKAKSEHTEGISETLRQIKGVEVSAVLKESDPNTTKVSLRSKTVDVSEVASHFQGGGHTFAAGCTIHKPLNIAADKLLEVICEKI